MQNQDIPSKEPSTEPHDNTQSLPTSPKRRFKPLHGRNKRHRRYQMQTLVAGPLPKLQKFGTNISNAERLFNKLFHDPMEGEESPAVSPENSPERQSSQEDSPVQQSQEDDPPPEFYLRSLSSTIGSPPPDFVPRRSTRTTRPPERLQIGERPKLKPTKRRSTSCGPLRSAPAVPPESDNDMDISMQLKHP